MLNRESKAAAIETWLTWLAAGAAIAFFFYTIWKCAVNIPFTDDYTEILVPINSFSAPGGTASGLSEIFSAQGYSNAVVMRVAALISFLLMGTVDFKFLILLGHLGLLGLLTVLYHGSGFRRSLYILPVVLLLFQWQYWEASLEATLALSVPLALFFSFLSILLLQKDSPVRLAASAVCAVLATFSFGNGFLVFPAAVLLLLLQRRYRSAITMLGVFALSLTVYLHNYSLEKSDKGFGSIFTEPLKAADWFLTFLGSSLGYASQPGYVPAALPHAVSILVGIVISGFYLYLAVTHYYKRNPVVFAWYTFMLLTALVAVRCRLLDEVPSASRYQIQSVILVIITFLVIMDLLNDRCRKVVFPVILLASAMFALSSYQTYFPTTCLHKNRLIFGMSNWLTSQTRLISCSKDQDAPNRIMLSAAKAGIYCIPDADYMAEEFIILPGNYNTYYQRGMLHGRARNYTQAIADLSTVISNSPSSLSAYDGRMRMYHAMGNYDLAWNDANTLMQAGHEIDAWFLNILKTDSADNKKLLP